MTNVAKRATLGGPGSPPPRLERDLIDGMRREDGLRLLRAALSILLLGLAASVQAGEGARKLPPLQCRNRKGEIVVPTARIRKVGHGVSRPELLTSIRPAWPESLRVAGTTVLEAIIDSSGRVCAVRVLKTPSPEIGKAFESALREARFKPARLDGKPVPVWYSLTVYPHLQ
jgi:hypothetical protein